MHVYLFFVLFVFNIVVISKQWLVLWYLWKRERDFFFKDIIVVMISVHNRGRIEIEKSRKKRIYWSNTHRYRIQRYTLTLQPARLHPKLSKREKSCVTEITTTPDCSLLLLILGFLSKLVVALQQIHSLLVSRVLAKYCLATQRISRRGGGVTEGSKKQGRKPQCHNC